MCAHGWYKSRRWYAACSLCGWRRTSQDWNSSAIRFPIVVRGLSLAEMMTLYSKQSSANSRAVELTLNGKSLIKTRKSSGPSTVHWGTPDVTGAGADFSPYTTSCRVLWLRKSWIQAVCFLALHNQISLVASLRWEALSNALLKSNSTASICCLSLSPLARSWVDSRTTSSSETHVVCHPGCCFSPDGWLHGCV